MNALNAPDVDRSAFVSSGLSCARRGVEPTRCGIRHTHIEVSLIRQGLVTYLDGGRQIRVGSGRLVAFWSAIPHPIVKATHNAEYYLLTLPLTWFLQHRFPEEFLHLVLDGQALVDPVGNAGCDFAMFDRWIEDLQLRQPLRERIVLLEVEARLLRLAEALSEQGASPGKRLNAATACDQNSALRIRQMLAFIAQNYTNQLTVDLIGKSAGIHPNYAMHLFRKTVGTSLVTYLTRLRVSHAQQLLATSDAKVIDVAFSAGFNSLSRFNDAFKRVCGSSPREYRERCHLSGLN